MTPVCEEIRERLHDWMDGALELADRDSVRSHLDRCSGCRSELDALEALRAEAARLPSEVRPPRDLWTEIEPRLGRPWWRRLLPAAGSFELRPSLPVLAGAAALVALGAGLWLWQAGPVPTAPGTRAAAARGADADLETQAALARSEDGMLGARRDLIRAVQRQRDHLSPETVAVLEENMLIIDQAIGQLRSALEEDPLNRRLSMRLAAQYQREAQLTKRVSGA